MGKSIAIVIVMISSVALAQQAKTPSKITLYKTASDAACSGDATVWVDPEAHAYYVRGDKLFGKTKHGGYSCRQQADTAGYRALKSR